MFVDSCIFIDGQHAWGGKSCPHSLDHDETGPVQPTGWTVQHPVNP